MGIINMVYGGGGGGGTAYKTYSELKAMNVDAALNELNSDGSGYYDALNENERIFLDIFIGNDDLDNVCRWGNSYLRYDNGVWIKETCGENIVLAIRADGDGYLRIPVCGYNSSGGYGASYNWYVSYDYGTSTQYQGASGLGLYITVASGLTANSRHIVEIKPKTEGYAWARAFCFLNIGIGELLDYIIYDESYKGYGKSSTDTGASFRRSIYSGCVNLKNTAPEIIPNTVTTIGNKFRQYEYRSCCSIQKVSGNEVCPNSVTSIGEDFRSYQYYGCGGLTRAPQEAISNSITSIENNFRNNQYEFCSSLVELPDEVLHSGITTIKNYFRSAMYQNTLNFKRAAHESIPNTVTSIGNYFRANQYRYARGLEEVDATESMSNSLLTIGTDFRYEMYYSIPLKTAQVENIPNTVTSIGNNFRYGNYSNCSSLEAPAAEVMSTGILTIGNYFRRNQYYYCTKITSTAVEVLPSTFTSVGTYFRQSQYQGCSKLVTATLLANNNVNSSYKRSSQFSSAGSTSTPMTITILGDVVEATTSSCGLSDNKVAQINVKSSLVSGYKSSSDWSAITDSKFVGY